MSLERRMHRRRERLGLYETNDRLRVLGKNFTVAAFMSASADQARSAGYDEGYEDGLIDGANGVGLLAVDSEATQ